jgi:DtxR family Mn-dependent transcriptional regulator
MQTGRIDNLSESLEDYLEAIFFLTRDSDVARSKDIAQKLGVARPSVTGALRILANRGLVNYQPYGFVSLTRVGQARAAAVAKKHDVIKSFFVDILGIEAETAARAACKAEHSIGKQISGKLTAFVEYITLHPNGKNLVSDFQKFHSRKNGALGE